MVDTLTVTHIVVGVVVDTTVEVMVVVIVEVVTEVDITEPHADNNTCTCIHQINNLISLNLST